MGTLRFWKLLATQSFALLGLLAAVGSGIVLFWPEFFRHQGWLAPLALIASLLYGILRAWPRPVGARYLSLGTTVRLVRGDLFLQTDSHLVIGMSDTFDTASPYIAPESVQGQFLQRVYGNDLAKLDAEIKEQLADVATLGSIAGKFGKTERYPLGTTVTLRANAHRYFLVAYTLMNNKSSASTTTDGVWNSLSELWKVVRDESNGNRVCMPMIGGGQSKLSPVLPAVDSVRFIAMSFILASRTRRVCDELVIVAPSKQYDALDHLEIQAFLNSLGSS